MIAKLRIETELRHHKTVLKNCFHTAPFKLLDITEDKSGQSLHLMLMNASPGVLDGDRYSMQASIGKGCMVQLHTQSYQRLFQMKVGATQCFDVFMEEGSTFCYLPHPSVPHQESNFTIKNKIYLSHNCTLLWGEVLTCGRKSSGEQFSFSKYHMLTEVFLNERMILKENLLMQPSRFDVSGIGQLEGYTHQASLLYLNETASIKKIADALYEQLLPDKEICFGITAVPANGLMVRILGNKGEHLHGVLKKLSSELMPKTLNGTPVPIKSALYVN